MAYRYSIAIDYLSESGAIYSINYDHRRTAPRAHLCECRILPQADEQVTEMACRVLLLGFEVKGKFCGAGAVE